MKSDQTQQGSPLRDFFAASRSDLKFCVERGRLLDLLNRASADYADAVHDLNDRIGTLTPAEYVRLRVIVDQARADAQHCREALYQHQREHGC